MSNCFLMAMRMLGLKSMDKIPEALRERLETMDGLARRARAEGDPNSQWLNRNSIGGGLAEGTVALVVGTWLHESPANREYFSRIPCPHDTNGDGDCGKPWCVHCANASQDGKPADENRMAVWKSTNHQLATKVIEAICNMKPGVFQPTERLSLREKIEELAAWAMEYERMESDRRLRVAMNKEAALDHAREKITELKRQVESTETATKAEISKLEAKVARADKRAREAVGRARVLADDLEKVEKERDAAEGALADILEQPREQELRKELLRALRRIDWAGHIINRGLNLVSSLGSWDKWAVDAERFRLSKPLGQFLKSGGHDAEHS